MRLMYRNTYATEQAAKDSAWESAKEGFHITVHGQKGKWTVSVWMHTN